MRLAVLLRALLFALLLPGTSGAAETILPAYAQVRAGWQSAEVRVLDRHGRLLQEIRGRMGPLRADWTGLDEVSPAFLAALLKAEDQRFFTHAGVDWLSAGKAALGNWLADRPRGASTLSMQLVGLLDPAYRAHAGRRDLGEKWTQMRAAMALERSWKKTEILETYLNLAGFRGELTGIDAAARGLFDKRPAGLNLGESLLLAVLVRAPNAPATDVARRACQLVADLPGGPDCAQLRRLAHNTLSGGHPLLPAANAAPHLAARLIREQPEAAGRGRLETTLDADLQAFVATTLKEQLERLAGRSAQDAAALVLDNARGEVLVYVSVSAPGSPAALNDGVTARRQAGSTLKPFLYGLALDRRLLTAASAIEDAPLAIATATGEYAPQNYDRAHHGLVSVRTALAASLNVPAVRTLQLTGQESFAASLASLGFDGLDEAADYYGYALALGSLDVRLDELTNAYRALANGGVHGPIRFTPGSPVRPGRHVLGKEAAFLVADILADRQARALTFGLENPLATRFWTAVKTGTSKDMRDNWCVGFSSRYTVGVWVGNFSGVPMHDVSGISGAAPAWAAIMGRLHDSLPSPPPPPPRGLVHKTVAPPGETPREEWFLAGTAPAGPTWTMAEPQPEILRPGRGDILALDPDIPPERQRLTPQARGMPVDAWWQLDGQRLADPAWPLTRGSHELILYSGEASELDRVRFEVR